MFGYLQVDKAELKVREWEAYKSVYCGLCRQMGRDYSFLSRLALSYDCTYYAMLLMSVHRSCTGFFGPFRAKRLQVQLLQFLVILALL